MARLSDLIREQASHPKSGVTQTSRTGASAMNSCRSWIASTRQELYRIKEVVHASKIPDVTRCASPAEQLVNLLRQSDDLIGWALNGQTDDYLVDNALHVAILATKVGIGLQYREQDLERLALAGLLHDLGMWTVPELLITKRGALTEEERDLIRAHPERGRRILAGQGSVFEWVASICAQEHERWDGSGYPCRLKHKQIAEPAQVIGIVDSFDAMVTTRPYRMNNSPHDVMRDLLLHGKTLFSLPVLKAIGDQITLYPVGTEVRLNTGESGTVKQTNPRHPLRPVVEISKFGEPNDLDLSQSLSVHIVGVVHARMAS
ncbi:MAG: HD domain-containing protein [Nitrospira sp.]|nr:HD domain-containing protein [Nitrospira sp.]